MRGGARTHSLMVPNQANNQLFFSHKLPLPDSQYGRGLNKKNDERKRGIEPQSSVW